MAGGMGNMMFSLPILLLVQQIDWTNDRNIFFGRLGFATATLLCALASVYIKRVRASRSAPPACAALPIRVFCAQF